MNVDEVYASGGFVAAHPSGNRTECWDGPAGVYTRWDAAGSVVESRALTVAEFERLAPDPVPADVRLATVEASVAELDSIIVAVLS